MAFAERLKRVYQRAKNIIHAVQALLIFVATMITIAIMTKDGQSDTRITYYLALCLLCIPSLIYQTAFPSFQRSKRFTNAYVHAIIDLLLTMLWFAAFIGEVVWAKDGTQAAKDFKRGDSICQVFGYGPTDKCKTGQVTMIFGVVICLLFALTTVFSGYAVRYYRSHGTLLGTNDSKSPETVQSDDLEFNGAPPNAYTTEQREMQQPEMQQQHVDVLDDGNVSPIEDEGNATLPPRPLYSKAPRLRQAHSFESLDTTHHSAQAHDTQPYHPSPSSYEAYANESGDFALPSHYPSRVGQLPSLRVDTMPRNGLGGGNVSFPVADYDR